MSAGTDTPFDGAGALELVLTDDGMSMLDATTGESIAVYEDLRECPTNISFSPDGSQYVLSDEGMISIYNTADGSEVLSYRSGHSSFTFFTTTIRTGAGRFVGDGLLVTTGGDIGSREYYLWDIRSGEAEQLARLVNEFTADLFTDAHDLLITGGPRWISFRDPLTAEEIDIHLGHSDDVTSLVLSPDGSRLLTGSSDGTAALWTLGG